jgi:putative transposase
LPAQNRALAVELIQESNQNGARLAKACEELDEYIPESNLATAPNQVWTWEITWLGGTVKGLYYRLYFILDLFVFSRKVVGWEVWEMEETKYAETHVKKAVISEKIQGVPPV